MKTFQRFLISDSNNLQEELERLEFEYERSSLRHSNFFSLDELSPFSFLPSWLSPFFFFQTPLMTQLKSYSIHTTQPLLFSSLGMYK